MRGGVDASAGAAGGGGVCDGLRAAGEHRGPARMWGGGGGRLTVRDVEDLEQRVDASGKVIAALEAEVVQLRMRDSVRPPPLLLSKS